MLVGGRPGPAVSADPAEPFDEVHDTVFPVRRRAADSSPRPWSAHPEDAYGIVAAVTAPESNWLTADRAASWDVEKMPTS